MHISSRNSIHLPGVSFCVFIFVLFLFVICLVIFFFNPDSLFVMVYNVLEPFSFAASWACFSKFSVCLRLSFLALFLLSLSYGLYDTANFFHSVFLAFNIFRFISFLSSILSQVSLVIQLLKFFCLFHIISMIYFYKLPKFVLHCFQIFFFVSNF